MAKSEFLFIFFDKKFGRFDFLVYFCTRFLVMKK